MPTILPPCVYLGEPNSKTIKIGCRPPRFAPAYQCLHPDRVHPVTLKPKPCIPHWAGPWPADFESDSKTFPLCDGGKGCGCPLRVNT